MHAGRICALPLGPPHTLHSPFASLAGAPCMRLMWSCMCVPIFFTPTLNFSNFCRARCAQRTVLRLDVLGAMMHATLTIVVARALVASADELLLQPGHCGVTTASRQSCAHDSQSSGAWKAASLRACLRRCASCPRCSVASYSSRDSDCSWYARCDVSTRGLTQGTGHETVVVRHTNGTVLRAVERLVEKDAGSSAVAQTTTAVSRLRRTRTTGVTTLVSTPAARGGRYSLRRPRLSASQPKILRRLEL